MNTTVTKYSPLMILHGLDSAREKIAEWAEKKPILNDEMSDQVVLNAWPFVTTAYSLLEQSLKALVMVLDKTYDEKEMKADSHSLNSTFRRLDATCVDRIRKGYRAYQSLHNYVGYTTLDEFMANIDKDYAKWRYFLLQGWIHGSPAKTSVEAMLEVSQQTIDALAAQVATDHGLSTVGDRLEFAIKTLWRNCLNSPVRRGKSIDREKVNLANKWLLKHGDSHVNAVSKVVRRLKREGVSIRDQVEADMAPLLEDFFVSLFNEKGPDMRQFLSRTVNDEHPLVWDRQQLLFVPCESKVEFEENH